MSVVYPLELADEMEKFLDSYDQNKYKQIKTKVVDSIFTIGSNLNGLMLLRHNINTNKYKSDIIESNYNDDFKEAYTKLVKFLGTKNESGLVLFKGKPGTGKSSLLLHLTTLAKELEVKFVFVPSSFTHILSEPSFLTFAVGHLKDAVLILEDAEEALITRGTGANSAVANILNIADGILGKILNLKLLTTVNREENIDDALKRKGRLKLDYNFDLLEPDKVNKLLKKLNINTTTTKAMSLADVYNINEDPSIGKSNVRKAIGFGK
jgi:SpoVK/Ycf46/Vps4 family AAA+-type ATPase